MLNSSVTSVLVAPAVLAAIVRAPSPTDVEDILIVSSLTYDTIVPPSLANLTSSLTELDPFNLKNAPPVAVTAK